MNKLPHPVVIPRSSNIELLRLLCMLMVLNLHSFGGYDHDHGSYLFQAIDFFRESTSVCAVDTFILISGFFGIKWKIKSLWNLIFQVLFYSIAVYLVASVVLEVIPFDKKELLRCLKGFIGSWGFIFCYITLYFFAPLLNAYVCKSDNKTLLVYIIVFWIAEVFVLRTHNGVMNFFLLYLIGRWISKTNLTNYDIIKPGRLYLLITCVIFLLSYTVFLVFHLDAEMMCNFVLTYSYASPFVILQSVFLFLLFCRFKIQNCIINWCASSCLSIFLIHMHPSIKYIGYYNFTESLYNKSVIEHLLILFLLIFIVFWGAILIDKIRIYVSNRLFNFIDLIWKIIMKKNNKLQTIVNRLN